MNDETKKIIKFGIGVFILLVIISPQIRSAVFSFVTGQPQSCDIALYDSNCVCDSNEDKIKTPDSRYICEPKEKVVDPSNPNWKQDALNYAEKILDEKYPNCDMKTCAYGEWRIGWGWHDNKERSVIVECWVMDKPFSKVQFYLTDGEIDSSYCYNYTELKPGNPTMYIKFKTYAKSVTTIYRNWFIFDVGKKCSMGTGTATNTITFTIPDDMENRTSWEIFRQPSESKCTLSDMTPRSVKITCIGECNRYCDITEELWVVTSPSDKIRR